MENKVYVRVSPSKIHKEGVGIFAIKDIPKNEYICYREGDMVWIEEEKIEDLDDEIKKLYKDFCIKKDGKYFCPDNFNNITPIWYLNHSKTPNVYCDVDDNYQFKALRNIKKGEELCTDYSEYADDVPVSEIKDFKFF